MYRPPLDQARISANFIPSNSRNLAYWIDPTQESYLTKGTQPTDVDWDMEAVGVASWTPENSAILTKVGSPYAGSQCLRSTFNGTTVFGWIKSSMIVGNRYEGASAWFKGNGSARVYFYNPAGVATLSTNPAPVAWTQLALPEFTATNASLSAIEYNGLGAGSFFDTDDFYVGANLSLTSITPRSYDLDMNLCVDGDMERDGYDDWGTVNSTLSKETSDPYEGTKLLRVAWDSGAEYWAYQTVLSSGNSYHVTGRARGDGAVAPKVYLTNVLIWTGTTSTEWQSIDATGTSDGAILYLGAVGGSGYADFDQVSTIDLDATVPTLDQSTAALQPWQDSTSGWIRFDGSADYLECDAPKDSFSFLHDGSAWTLSCAIELHSLPVDYAAIFANMGGNIHHGMVPLITSHGAIRWLIGNGSGTYALDETSATGTLAPEAPAIVTASYAGSGNVKVWVDGTKIIDAAPSSLLIGTPNTAMRLGVMISSYYLDGSIGDFLLYDNALSTYDLNSLERYLSDKHSIPLVGDELDATELETWNGLATWLDVDSSYVTKAAQPTNSNWGFETGDPPTGYTEDNGSTLSAQLTNPRTGSACARIVGDDSTPAPGIYQTESGLIVGNRYAASAWFRTTNSETARLYAYNAGSTEVLGTGSAAWEELETEQTLSVARIVFGGSEATSQIEVDDFTAENLSITAITPRAGSITDNFANATATDQPWEDSTSGWIRYEGSDTDALVSDADASSWNFMHDGTGGTLVLTVDLDATSSTYIFACTSQGAALGFSLYVTGGGVIYCRVGKGATYAYEGNTGAGAITAGKSILTLRTSAGLVDVKVNGTSVLSGVLDTPSSSNATHALALGNDSGSQSYAINGTMADVLAFDRVLSNSEVTRLENYLADKWSISI